MLFITCDFGLIKTIFYIIIKLITKLITSFIFILPTEFYFKEFFIKFCMNFCVNFSINFGTKSLLKLEISNGFSAKTTLNFERSNLSRSSVYKTEGFNGKHTI